LLTGIWLGLAAAAAAAAFAVGWLASLRRARRSRESVLRLARSGHLVVSALELDQLLADLVELLDGAYPEHAVAILLADPLGRELHVGALGRGHDPAHLSKRFVVGVEGVTGQAAAERRVVLVPDIAAESRYVRGLQHGGSELAVPIVYHDRLLGVLDLESPRRSDFGEEDVAAAKALADQVAGALENARLYGLLRQAVESLSHADEQLGQRSRRAGEGEMAVRAAHLLNDPLAAIIGNLSWARTQMPEDEARLRVSTALEQAQSAADRLKDLVGFARVNPAGRGRRRTAIDGLGVDMADDAGEEEARRARQRAGRRAQKVLDEAAGGSAAAAGRRRTSR
jgi:GAF domain-containing protein